MFQTFSLYLLIDLDGGSDPLSLVADQRQGFREIRHCDWLTPKLEHFRRRGRLVDIEPPLDTDFNQVKLFGCFNRFRQSE